MRRRLRMATLTLAVTGALAAGTVLAAAANSDGQEDVDGGTKGDPTVVESRGAASGGPFHVTEVVSARAEGRLPLPHSMADWPLGQGTAEARECVRTLPVEPPSAQGDGGAGIPADDRGAADARADAGEDVILPLPHVLAPDHPCGDGHPSAIADVMPWVAGAVAEADAEEMTLSVRTVHGLERFHVSSETGVAIDGRRGSFEELDAGMRVRVAHDDHQALRIMAIARPEVQPDDYGVGRPHEPIVDRPDVVESGPMMDWLSGHLSTMDHGALSLALRLVDGSETDLHLTEETGIALNGEPVEVDALESGMAVRVALDPESKMALRVMAATPVETQPSQVIEASSGWVGDVDADVMVLILRMEDGAQRFRVTEKTGVAIDGQRARLEDLEQGMPARVAHRGHEALRIMAASGEDAIVMPGDRAGVTEAR